jgi:hypothetical protein
MLALFPKAAGAYQLLILLLKALKNIFSVSNKFPNRKTSGIRGGELYAKM